MWSSLSSRTSLWFQNHSWWWSTCLWFDSSIYFSSSRTELIVLDNHLSLSSSLNKSLPHYRPWLIDGIWFHALQYSAWSVSLFKQNKSIHIYRWQLPIISIVLNDRWISKNFDGHCPTWIVKLSVTPATFSFPRWVVPLYDRLSSLSLSRCESWSKSIDQI